MRKFAFGALFLTASFGFAQPSTQTILFDGRSHLISLRGDVDGDGAVTQEDLITSLNNFGKTTDVLITDGDANGDGRVDAFDVHIIRPRIGLSIPDSNTAADRQALNKMVADGNLLLDDPVAARQWNEVFGRVDRWPTYAGGRTALQAHDTTVSEDWTENGHEVEASSNDGWPSTHFYTASRTWPVDHQQPASSAYPPNHVETMSATWPEQEHNLVLSKEEWPPTHRSDRSQAWYDQEHEASYSKLWPPNHAVSYSRDVWPPGHARVDSRQAEPPEPFDHELMTTIGYHLTFYSSGWPSDPPEIWPGNHSAGISMHWPGPEEHAQEVSYSWPPNHRVEASNTWDPGKDTWPPSHTQDASNATDPPADPEG